MNIFYANKYLCYDKPLYDGQFSTIYTGYNVKNQSHKLVIKKIKKNINKHFIREELNLMKQIQHTNVLPLLDYFYKKNKLYIVSHYCNNGNVLEYIQSKDHTYDQKYISELVKGITFLYTKNIIHRDIKPQNMLIQDHTIKICDFGLSKSMYLDSIKNSICGCPKYIAPELFTKKIYSRKSDIWSLGIILYEILYKVHPYVNKQVKDYEDFIFNSKDIPKYTELYRLIEAMLIVNESNRLTWKNLLEYDINLNSNNKPLIVSDAITIEHTRNRSASISFNPYITDNVLEELDIHDYNYSNSAPCFKLSNSLHNNYIDVKMTQKESSIKESSSTNNLNYHDIIGASPNKPNSSMFGYYYNKFFSSNN